MTVINLDSIKNLPHLYATESEEDPLFQIRFYFSDVWGNLLFEWYASEAQQEDNEDITMFGYVCNKRAPYLSELGYFSLAELSHINVYINGFGCLEVKQDLNFKPMTFRELKKQWKNEGC